VLFHSYSLFFIPFADTPSFAISRTPGFGYPLREGIEVSLKCDVDSNPPSTPRWQKDDGDTPVSLESYKTYAYVSPFLAQIQILTQTQTAALNAL